MDKCDNCNFSDVGYDSEFDVCGACQKADKSMSSIEFDNQTIYLPKERTLGGEQYVGHYDYTKSNYIYVKKI